MKMKAKVRIHRFMTTRALIAALALAGSAFGAWAADMLGEPTMSSEKGGASQTLFAPDTAELFLQVDLTGVASGSTLTCTWIAEDTHGAAPANFKIAATDFKVGSIDNEGDCSVSKPNAGWPVGTYRVDLAVNGQTIKNAKFSVAQQ
jgi:hypothetical protein